MLFVLTYLAGQQSHLNGVTYDGANVSRGSNVMVNNSAAWTNGTFVSPLDRINSVLYDPVAGKTPIYVATVYRGVPPVGGTRKDFGDVDVVISVENKPLILALNAYSATVWHVKPANERVKIMKVVAYGYHPMRLTGVPNGAEVVKLWYKHLDADDQHTREVAPENQVNRLPSLMIFGSSSLSTLNSAVSDQFKKHAKALEDWSGGTLAQSEACYNGRLFKFPISDLNSH